MIVLKPVPDQNPEKPKPILFEDWARAKYNEIEKLVNPCDENGNIDPVRLNEVLTKFSQNFAWAITLQEVELNKFNVLSHEYDLWYKDSYNKAMRTLIEEAGGVGRAPSQATIEARIVQTRGVELLERQKGLEEQRSKVDLLKGFVKVLEKQANVLQTLSSNMRSELFFASGLAIGEMKSSDDRREAVKNLLHKAMTGDKAQDS